MEMHEGERTFEIPDTSGIIGASESAFAKTAKSADGNEKLAKAKKLKSKKIGSENSDPSFQANPISEPPPPVSREIVENSIKALLGVIDESVQTAVRGKAFDITADREFANVYGEKVAVTQTEQKQIGSLTAEVLAQYGLLGQHTPAMFLLVFVGAYVGRVTMAVRSLRKLESEKASLKPKEESKP